MWKTLLTGLVVVLSSSLPAGAQVTLVPRQATWKYEATGTDLGTAWRDTTHDDSEWPSGPGILGYGEGYITTMVPYGPVGRGGSGAQRLRDAAGLHVTVGDLVVAVLDEQAVPEAEIERDVVEVSRGLVRFPAIASDDDAVAHGVERRVPDAKMGVGAAVAAIAVVPEVAVPRGDLMRSTSRRLPRARAAFEDRSGSSSPPPIRSTSTSTCSPTRSARTPPT